MAGLGTKRIMKSNNGNGTAGNAQILLVVSAIPDPSISSHIYQPFGKALWTH